MSPKFLNKLHIGKGIQGLGKAGKFIISEPRKLVQTAGDAISGISGSLMLPLMIGGSIVLLILVMKMNQ